MNRECTLSRLLPSLVLGMVAVFSSLQKAEAQDPLGRAAATMAEDPARAAFESMSEEERRAVQDALVWAGVYSGGADGVFGRQTVAAIAAFQQSRRKTPNGILAPRDRADLQALAQREKSAVGFTIVDDPKTGMRIGVPLRLLPKQSANAGGGSRWQSTDERITLDTRTPPTDATLASLYERNLAIQSPGRMVTYKVLRADFFVIAGETPSGRFYTRFAADGPELRGLSIGYDKALSPQMDRLVVAIANSFEPVGDGPVAPVARALAAAPAPPPIARPGGRRLIGTGIAVTPRRVLTTVSLDVCGDLQVGNVPRGDLTMAASPQAGGIRAIELSKALSNSLPAILPSLAETEDPVLVAAYDAEDGRFALTLVPGTMLDPRSLSAPLQAGAGGAPVLDREGRLVGIVAPVSAEGRKVAGIMTTGRHAVIPASELGGALSATDPASGSTAQPGKGAASISAYWRPALLPLTCGP